MRKIYEVHAKIVDANGTHSTLSGYPKTFDSRSYNNNIEKAFQRARGEYHETLGAMYKRDDRQIQTVILTDEHGNMYANEAIGELEENLIPDETEEE